MTTQDYATLAAVITLVVDWMQTRYISKNPDKYHEINKILGLHPSLEAVNIYFALCIVGVLALSHFFVENLYVTGFLIALAFFEALVTAHNYKIGIGEA